MVFFNYALRKLNAKIVYYGPGLCGKTTNLQWIHDHFEGGQRGKMISLSTEGDRTIFFDLLPLEIGSIRGMDVTLQLYTVPGQVHYNSTRQLVLRGADGVVFVADSQSTMRGSNIDSLRNLEDNLSLQGIDLADFPHVLQFNKRDLGDLISVDDLDSDLNRSSVPFFEAIATDGVGIQETLEGIVKLVMRNLRERYEPVVAAGIAGHDAGPVPLDVEVPAVPLRPSKAPAIATPPPPVNPLHPRRPLAPPMPAARSARGIGRIGLQDDVPTRVYPEGRPPVEHEQPSLAGESSWEPDGSRATTAERPLPSASRASKERDDFGFAMPFADIESTTDVNKLDAAEEALPAEPVVAGYRHAGDELERVAAALQSEPSSPFPVGDLTPEPITAETVFGETAAPVERVEMPTSEADRPPSWPARLRGTVDDLVASVLGARTTRAAPAEPPPSEIPELRDALEAELASLSAVPSEEVAAEAPLSEEVAAEVPPSEEVAADLDWWEPGEGGPAAVEEYVLVDEGDFDQRVAEPAGFDEPSGEWAAEPAAEPVRGFLDEPSGAFGADGISMRDAEIQATAQQEGFVVGEPIEVAPPPLDAGDWYEAHTGDVLEVELGEAPEQPWAEPGPVEPFLDVAASAPGRVVEPRHLITLGEGDPFGDVVDDQPTPVRREIEPHVMVPEPSFDRLVRADDNQLHLRLHGTGAIAESGQVRALDIEVPVPGTWVGNRRVILQLRLTLLPVAEDDDGGSGRAP